VTPSTPSEAAKRIDWARHASLLLVPLAILLLGPFRPMTARGDIDPSWQEALHHAFVARLSWGTEFVFTYGPWGLLWNDIHHPDTFSTVLAARCVLAGLLAFSLVLLARSSFQRPLVGLGWATACLLLPIHSMDSTLYVAVLLWWLLGSVPGPRVRLVRPALLATLAFFALGKFLLLLTLLSVVVVDSVAVGLTNRRSAVEPIGVLVASLAVAWLLAGQGLGNVYPYLWTSWEVASGFGQSMSARGALAEPALFLVCAAALFFQLHRMADGTTARLRLTGLALLFLVVFRHSFTRHDAGHALIGSNFLIASAVLLIPWVRLPKLVVAVVAVVTVNSLLWAGFEPAVSVNLPPLASIPDRVEILGDLLLADPAPATRLADERAGLAASVPIGEVTADVDVFPHAQHVLFAHGLDWNPRPVIQGNTVYTPRLVEINARHVRERGPKTLLWDVDPIDAHHPAEADAHALLETLTRYDVVDPLGRFVTFQRRGVARELQSALVFEVEVAPGARVELPALTPRDGARELLWLRIEERRSLWDRAVGSVWKRPLLVVEVSGSDGDSTRWTVSPRVAEAGFPIAPMLVDRLSLAALLSDGRTDLLQSAKAIRIGRMNRARGLGGRGFSVRVDRLTLQSQPGLRVPGGLGLLPSLQSPVRPMEEHSPWIRGPGGRTVLFAHSPSELELLLRRGLVEGEGAAFVGEVQFGVLPGAGAGEMPTDGVVFSVAYRDQDGERTLWEERVEPGDEALKSVTFEVPVGWLEEPEPWPAGRARLVLRTSPGGSAASDWGYWAGLGILAR
jgi:hypothetical protein